MMGQSWKIRWKVGGAAERIFLENLLEKQIELGKLVGKVGRAPDGTFLEE